MKRWSFLIVSIAILGTSAAPAQCPHGWSWWKSWYTPSCCAPGCCPDDYCTKKLPIAVPVKCGGPNDYCAKKMPAAPPSPPGTCYDYDPKSQPPVFPLVPGPWHTCGPPERCDCPRHP